MTKVIGNAARMHAEESHGRHGPELWLRRSTPICHTVEDMQELPLWVKAAYLVEYGSKIPFARRNCRSAFLGLTRRVIIANDVHTASTAVIFPGAELRPGAFIGDYAIIRRGVKVGNAVVHEYADVMDAAVIHKGCTIGTEAKVGRGTVMRKGSTTEYMSELGRYVWLLRDVTVGHDAQVGDNRTVYADVPSGEVLCPLPRRGSQQYTSMGIPQRINI